MKSDPFLNNTFLNSLTDKIEQFTPPGLLHLRDEIAEVVKSILKEALGKMDLITREEFDVQSAVLNKTRLKLEALEARINALEEKTTVKKPVKKTKTAIAANKSTQPNPTKA